MFCAVPELRLAVLRYRVGLALAFWSCLDRHVPSGLLRQAQLIFLA
jgi:hypothetical protein